MLQWARLPPRRRARLHALGITDRSFLSMGEGEHDIQTFSRHISGAPHNLQTVQPAVCRLPSTGIAHALPLRCGVHTPSVHRPQVYAGETAGIQQVRPRSMKKLHRVRRLYKNYRLQITTKFPYVFPKDERTVVLRLPARRKEIIREKGSGENL